MAMSFNDLDVDLQRSVFAAISILAILLSVCLLSKWVHYAFTLVCVVASGYMAFMLFVKPKLKRKEK